MDKILFHYKCQALEPSSVSSIAQAFRGRESTTAMTNLDCSSSAGPASWLHDQQSH